MAIHSTVSSFNLSLSKYGKTVIPDFARGRVTVVALTGAKALTERTRVDEGRAKGNWQFSLRDPAEGEIERLEPTPEGTAGRAVQTEVLGDMPSWKPGEWIWFHNGVPYIGVLDDLDSILSRTKEYLESWLRSAK